MGVPTGYGLEDIMLRKNVNAAAPAKENAVLVSNDDMLKFRLKNVAGFGVWRAGEFEPV